MYLPFAIIPVIIFSWLAWVTPTVWKYVGDGGSDNIIKQVVSVFFLWFFLFLGSVCLWNWLFPLDTYTLGQVIAIRCHKGALRNQGFGSLGRSVGPHAPIDDYCRKEGDQAADQAQSGRLI
jgi:hypothetical protein